MNNRHDETKAFNEEKLRFEDETVSALSLDLASVTKIAQEADMQDGSTLASKDSSGSISYRFKITAVSLKIGNYVDSALTNRFNNLVRQIDSTDRAVMSIYYRISPTQVAAFDRQMRQNIDAINRLQIECGKFETDFHRVMAKSP